MYCTPAKLETTLEMVLSWRQSVCVCMYVNVVSSLFTFFNFEHLCFDWIFLINVDT